MTEPAWIEHDGSDVCPVPNGHDVEVRLAYGNEHRDHDPEAWCWGYKGVGAITHYRDWTAFEQQQAEVPKWALREMCKRAMVGWDDYLAWAVDGSKAARVIEAGARLITQHEPPPRDRLREIILKASVAADSAGHWLDGMTAQMRARLPQAALDAIEELDDD